MQFFLYPLILYLLLFQPVHADVSFLSISDIHYGSENTPGDGHDTDPLLLASALNKFSHLTQEVDFIITLGDFPTHHWLNSPKIADYIRTVFHDLYQADSAAKPLFYITGNNDSLQGDYQPFSLNGKSPLSLAPDWQGACAHCKGLLLDGTHLADGGYYSTYVVPGNQDMLLIVLNSVQFTRAPFFFPTYPEQMKDALQQLQWLEMQLKTHHAKQLLIAMHVPPGMDYKGRPSWHEPYLKQFINVLNQTASRYGQISLLTAHSHMDDIRKIRLDSGLTIYAYATPSISRIHHNNPGMKIFQFDSDLKLKDYTTYYTTTDEPWENTHYSAIKGADSLFPSCHGQLLVTCLDSLDAVSICKRFKEGLFYGVKSPRVDASVCKLTYPITAVE